MIRTEKNDAKMSRWRLNGRPEDRISVEDLRTRLKFKSMRECLLRKTWNEVIRGGLK